MFFQGWAGLGRVAVVGVLAYVALVLLLRVSGKRTLSKMNTLGHNIGDAGAYSPVAGITPGIARCNRILPARQPRFPATHHCPRESPMLWPSVSHDTEPAPA